MQTWCTKSASLRQMGPPRPTLSDNGPLIMMTLWLTRGTASYANANPQKRRVTVPWVVPFSTDTLFTVTETTHTHTHTKHTAMVHGPPSHTHKLEQTLWACNPLPQWTCFHGPAYIPLDSIQCSAVCCETHTFNARPCVMSLTLFQNTHTHTHKKHAQTLIHTHKHKHT